MALSKGSLITKLMCYLCRSKSSQSKLSASFTLYKRGLETVKRYPNGTVTGTCSMVRGPDDKPEIGSEGSVRESLDVVKSGSETTQSSSTFDLCSQDIKDRSFATNQKEMLPPPVPP
nr:PREDICTED: uncharacterized protein LOC105661924 isoform X1 [Megachile rotundata]XP_012136082.1 PREDICTED: uncharacterized protein LOC105661924 isoform X1 [Megachile rotundata]